MSTSSVLGIVIVIGIIIAGVVFFGTSREATAPEATVTPEPRFTSEVSPIIRTSTPSPTVSVSPAASASPSASVPVPASSLSISIEDTGFAPKQITVDAGATVTFVNNGQAMHWPASDPHPTHTALKGFDAGAGLQTGETYSFTFTQAGTWGFHDHLNTQLKGSVVVK